MDNRERELEALEAYRRGIEPAPTLYREGAVKAIEEGRPMVFVASSETPDRFGDVIRADGWQLESFRRNPVLMYVHDYRTPPVGIVPRVWVDDKKLLNTVRFDTEDPFGAFLEGKYARGVMKAESVGFKPLEFKPLGKDGREFTRCELLEISCVPVSANVDALVQRMLRERRLLPRQKLSEYDIDAILRQLRRTKSDLQRR